MSSRPCFEHVGACADPYPCGNAGREGEGQPHGQAPVIRARRRAYARAAARARPGGCRCRSLPCCRLPSAHQVSCGRACHRRLTEADDCLQLVAGKRLSPPFGDSGVGQDARGPTRGVRVPAPLVNTGGVQSHEPCVRARKVRRPGTRRLQVSLVIHRSQAQVAALPASAG